MDHARSKKIVLFFCVYRHSPTNAVVTFRMVTCKSQFSTHIINYVRIYEGVESKSKLQHTGT
jgi:hypothetical protein